MRNDFLVTGALLALLMVGCGGPAVPTPTPISIEDLASPSEALRTRTEAATKMWNEGDWLGFYEFKSPRSVKPRFPYGLPAVQLCTKEQFVIDSGTKLAKLRISVGLEEDAPLSWQIDSVFVDGIEGRVDLGILHEGEPIDAEFNDYFGVSTTSAQWIFVDGEWWIEEQNWKEGCHDMNIIG